MSHEAGFSSSAPSIQPHTQAVVTYNSYSQRGLRNTELEDRDKLFLRLFEITAQQAEKLQSQLRDTEETKKEPANNLEKKVCDLQNDVEESRVQTNRETLERLNAVFNSSLIPNKELVWKKRVLTELLQRNPAAPTAEIELVYSLNLDTRRQLRIYLDEYKKSLFSNIKSALIAYAKLHLKNNPLLAWDDLKLLLDRAKAKFDNQPDSFLVSETRTYQQAWGPLEKEIITKYYYELEPEFAARLLFSNPNLASADLWTQHYRIFDKNDF
jgi:hypothetical protein